jgi:electron transfer flavoprotein alpha subunit
MNRGIYIIGEHRHGRVTEETLELVSFATQLDARTSPTIVFLGKDITGSAHELAAKTGCHVLAVTGASLEPYNSLSHGKVLLDLLMPEQPGYICLAHTSTGYDLAPAIAAGLDAPCITAVEGVSGGIFSRSAFSGRFVEEVTPSSPTVVLTIQPGSFSRYAETPASPGMVTEKKSAPFSCAVKALGIREPIQRDSTLKDAEVIVSAGRGLGKKENLVLLKELAALFPRSALGASRPACDLGWLEYSHQIGTTGQTVSPKAYLACGISGAIQHVSGMKTSQIIVAVNTDPHAAIFRHAHYGIVEDLLTFIPVLIEEIRSKPE